MFKLQSNLPLWNLVCLYCLYVTSCRGLYLDYSRLDYRASGTLPVMLVWWMWHEAILWSTHKACHKLYNYELKLCQHYWQLFVVEFLISRCPCLPFNSNWTVKHSSVALSSNNEISINTNGETEVNIVAVHNQVGQYFLPSLEVHVEIGEDQLCLWACSWLNNTVNAVCSFINFLITSCAHEESTRPLYHIASERKLGGGGT